MMLHINFELLNRILTILLNLCCSHDSTFMRSAQSCDVYAEKCCCSCKHLHKDYPFCTSYLVHSLRIERNPTLNKCFCDCCISTKVLAVCCFLLAACPRFVQMLALALPSIKYVIIQRKRRRDSQKETFRVCPSRPFCMSFLSLPARPLTADPAQSKSWTSHHS